MTLIVIGNILALIASCAMVYSGFVKKKNEILIVQSVQIGFFIASNVVLGGISGAIINAINLLRNILCYKDKLNLLFKILISVASITLTIAFNNLGIIGYLPLIASVVYVWLMDLKNVVYFKLLIIFTVVLWLVYDFTIKSYVACAFDVLTIATSVYSIIRINIDNKKKEETDSEETQE